MKLLCTVYVCVLTQYEYTHAHPSLLSYSLCVGAQDWGWQGLFLSGGCVSEGLVRWEEGNGCDTVWVPR